MFAQSKYSTAIVRLGLFALNGQKLFLVRSNPDIQVDSHNANIPILISHRNFTLMLNFKIQNKIFSLLLSVHCLLTYERTHFQLHAIRIFRKFISIAKLFDNCIYSKNWMPISFSKFSNDFPKHKRLKDLHEGIYKDKNI